MKKGIWILMFSATAFFTVLPTQKSHAVVWVVIQEALKKIILAMDKQVQKLQNKTIGLQNAQKKVENTLSKLKLKEISEWGEKQRKLYDKYYQELWKVKNAISTYKKVKGIILSQVQLVEEYKKAYRLFKQDKHFTPDEIIYMEQVYSGILDESVKNLDQLFIVINSSITQMSDAERLEVINRSTNNIEENISDLRRFNSENILLSLRRSSDAMEIAAIKNLYGIK